jgi:LytS/YehU family sensor histidine kinase
MMCFLVLILDWSDFAVSFGLRVWFFLFFQGAPASVSSLVEQQNDQVQRALLLVLIPVVVAFSFIVFVFYRSKRETFFKQHEAYLKLSIAEGELKALRAQMSPHFIFNCLNSIHHYMHTNQAQAGEYLVKFSQLIRHVLESSAVRMVPLMDEVEANKNYIRLEQLRLNHSFDFEIHFSEGLPVENIHIPPMLIQPFIENSIWHGLSQAGKGGRIDIFFTEMDDRHIQCVIEDNGKVSEAKSELDLSRVIKKTSMGMALIQERINLINSLNGTKAKFEIQLRPDDKAGKRVILVIPYED